MAEDAQPDRLLRDRLLALVAADGEAMAILALVREIGLPDWAVGAGFLRNRLWDCLTGSRTCSAADDIDLLYFDPADPAGKREPAIERWLAALRPGLVWQARNQARMHVKNDDRPYAGTMDAIAHRLETCTAVAVRLEPDGRLRLLAPYSLDDLFAMICRPTPAGLRRIEAHRERVAAKAWDRRWPGVVIRAD